MQGAGVNVLMIDRPEVGLVEMGEGHGMGRERIVPAFKDGVCVGFRLAAMRADSPFAHLGFRVGDIIERVNGNSLASPELALELYGKLKDEQIFVVDLERDGRPVHNVYIVR